MTTPEPAELPPPWDKLWVRRVPSGRGRPATLSLDDIVNAAVSLADDAGIHTVSMNRLADRLSCTPMALYRHVANKDELVALMVDHSFTPDPPAPATGASWQASLKTWARRLAELAEAHPWLPWVNLAQTPVGPHRLSWMERGLLVVADADFEEEVKGDAILLVANFVWDAVRLAQQMEQTGDEPPRSFAGLISIVDPEKYPNFVRMVRSQQTTGTTQHQLDSGVTRVVNRYLEFGLSHILDGLSAHNR